MHPSPQPTHLNTDRASVLAALRSLVPNRLLTLTEALRLAELQAGRLLQLSGVTVGPVSEDIVMNQPRILVEPDAGLPVHAASGCSRWDADRRSWVISLNPEEPLTRQRFTMLHEYKHILDHYNQGLNVRATQRFDPVEYVADYFAGCALIPKKWLKAAYYGGIQRLAELADIFDGSPRAVEVRLTQIGITPRAEPLRTPSRYRRQRPQPFAKHLTRTFARRPAPLAVRIKEHTADD